MISISSKSIDPFFTDGFSSVRFKTSLALVHNWHVSLVKKVNLCLSLSRATTENVRLNIILYPYLNGLTNIHICSGCHPKSK